MKYSWLQSESCCKRLGECCDSLYQCRNAYWASDKILCCYNTVLDVDNFIVEIFFEFIKFLQPPYPSILNRFLSYAFSCKINQLNTRKRPKFLRRNSVKFGRELPLSSKIHGITSEKSSTYNHSENFKTHVYFVFFLSTKSLITITLSVIFLLNCFNKQLHWLA